MPRNGGPRRTELQKAYHRDEIAARYLRGESQASIGRDLGLSQQQVSADVKWLGLEWQRRASANIIELRAEQIAKLDLLERTFWEAWDASFGGSLVDVVEYARLDEPQRPDTAPSLKVGRWAEIRSKVARSNGAGNPAYLEGVRRCIQLRIRLLGLATSQVFYSVLYEEHRSRSRLAFVTSDDNIVPMPLIGPAVEATLAGMEPAARTGFMNKYKALVGIVQSLNQQLTTMLGPQALAEETDSDPADEGLMYTCEQEQ
jgi:hypothetical protein